jgi:hypothetical protein
LRALSLLPIGERKEKKITRDFEKEIKKITEEIETKSGHDKHTKTSV